MAIKILIGGSPCTHWSIAQKNNRETKAEGIGWELFRNYLIAKEKFKPDFFLYENNKSAAQAIKDQIAEEFGVGVDLDVRFTYINSALVSAQNRQRFYVTNFGDIEQPEDRGILLKDILETGNGFGAMGEKAFALTATYSKGDSPDRILEKHQRTMACEPVRRAEPIRAGCMPSPDGTIKNSQGMRVYSSEGKSVNLTAQGGGLGAKTGLYAIPVNATVNDKSYALTSSSYYKCGENPCSGFGEEKRRPRVAEKVGYAIPVEWNDKGVPAKAVSCADGKTYTVYEVKDGQITIKGKQYPIKLSDGYYIIRKLTVRECARLQTMPDDYCKAVSDSQAYKALGNGWTAEVIIHLLNLALKDVPRDEEIVVLSLYDGIATGRYCLDKMGFTNVTYHAYEIDKYPIMVAMDNYPDIIQHGNAFAVREDDWQPPQTRSEWLDDLLGGDL
jgi:DNA (cytosine-5)-methyltransferase 3A